MNKEEYKKRIKQEFEKRNLNGFANHTILADLMADICTDVVKENCNLPVVMPQSELLKVLGRHIAQQYDLAEDRVIEQLEWKAKNL